MEGNCSIWEVLRSLSCAVMKVRLLELEYGCNTNYFIFIRDGGIFFKIDMIPIRCDQNVGDIHISSKVELM